MDPDDGCGLRWGGRILRALDRAPAESPAALFVRHSARGAFTDIAHALDVPLSDEGRREAVRFGRSLPLSRRVRLGHSPVERCEETARLIAEGVTLAGGTAEVEGMDFDLGGPYLVDPRAMVRLAGEGDFPRAWLDGRIPEDVVQPAPVAAQGQAAVSIRAIGRGEPGDLWILVSHDWNILVVREVLFGLRHEDVGWVDFLDGIAFFRAPGGLAASLALPDGGTVVASVPAGWSD
jgi:broad specificity phosphatase PhoE